MASDARKRPWDNNNNNNNNNNIGRGRRNSKHIGERSNGGTPQFSSPPVSTEALTAPPQATQHINNNNNNNNNNRNRKASVGEERREGPMKRQRRVAPPGQGDDSADFSSGEMISPPTTAPLYAPSRTPGPYGEATKSGRHGEERLGEGAREGEAEKQMAALASSIKTPLHKHSSRVSDTNNENNNGASTTGKEKEGDEEDDCPTPTLASPPRLVAVAGAEEIEVMACASTRERDGQEKEEINSHEEKEDSLNLSLEEDGIPSSSVPDFDLSLFPAIFREGEGAVQITEVFSAFLPPEETREDKMKGKGGEGNDGVLSVDDLRKMLPAYGAPRMRLLLEVSFFFKKKKRKKKKKKSNQIKLAVW